MRVKICGITRPVDAQACERAGVDAIGLVFAQGTPRFVDVDTARRIRSKMSPFLTAVGVFRGSQASDVVEISRQVGLDVVQVHDSSPEMIRELIAAGLRVIVAVSFRPGLDLTEPLQMGASAVLVDGALPGSGRSFDWQAARELRGAERLIVAGGMNPDNVGAAVSELRPWAVDVSSGVESRPGVKDAELIRRFVTSARAESGERVA